MITIQSRKELIPNGTDGKTEIFRDTVDGHARTVLFVNSEAHPNSHIPLDHYYYQGPVNNRKFYRLYKNVWAIDVGDGFTVEYNQLVWYEISVKDHCKQALSNMIDGLKAAEEFLV